MKKPKSMDYMKYERSMGMNRTPDKHEQLTKYVKQLESERAEMIEALGELLSLTEIMVRYENIKGFHPEIANAKTALRNAGVAEE